MVNNVKFTSSKRETHEEIKVPRTFSYICDEILWRNVRTEFEEVTYINIEISFKKKSKISQNKKSNSQNKNLAHRSRGSSSQPVKQKRTQTISFLRLNGS